MDVKRYIETGILELYIAGELGEDEMIAITKNVNAYPEIRAEVERLENAFIAYASLHAPPISKALEKKILSIGDKPIPPLQKSNFRSLFCGFGFLLLLASLAFNVYQYQIRQKLKKQIAAAAIEKETTAQNLKNLEEEYESSKKRFSEIIQPATQTVILESTGKVPDAQAIVFWNTETQNIYVDASALPEPPAGKVYQLWWLLSLDPLTPNDAGLLDDFVNNEQKLFTAKSTDKAVAFAITLEPTGGSEQPTLSELYVLGTI